MAFKLENFQDPQLDRDYLEYLTGPQAPDHQAHYQRLWNYFQNPLVPATDTHRAALNENSRPYFQAQEVGLPARITGISRSSGPIATTDYQRKEVVIENDIAWRVQTMIDFLFGHCPTFRSLAKEESLASDIEQILQTLLEANGGVSFLQEASLFGSIYGFVDIALRLPTGGMSPFSCPSASTNASVPLTSNVSPPRRSGAALAAALEAARQLRLETVEAPRVTPILEEDDYRQMRYWIQRYHKTLSKVESVKTFGLSWPWASRTPACPAIVEVIEILGPYWWQRYENRTLVAEGPNPMGRIPIIHIQNIALPGDYKGISDVEPLIPLQDELNTRLCDRAHRVTYQSFKMYLGKGIDDFLERPVGPGQMWATHNSEAQIEEFGNDSGSPSEDAHIHQVRQALDKISGVPPVAAGLIQGHIGHLTSATALKIVLSGLLAKTARKRLTYGGGLQAIAELTLQWLNDTGLFTTQPEDRRVEIHWPNLLPSDEGEQLRNAQIKQQLGVANDTLLAELGYKRQNPQ